MASPGSLGAVPTSPIQGVSVDEGKAAFRERVLSRGEVSVYGVRLPRIDVFVRLFIVLSKGRLGQRVDVQLRLVFRG